MRIGVRVLNSEKTEVLGFVDFDLRGKDLEAYRADPEAWRKETGEVLTAMFEAHHRKLAEQGKLP